MNRINIQRHQCETGELLLGSLGGRLCLVELGDRGTMGAVGDRVRKKLDAELVEQNDGVLETTKRQLDEYLNGDRKWFEIPLLIVGTDFQRRVWKALIEIPCGATSTYAQIAEDVGNPRAVRAVGNASRANPISIIIPCHRVLGSDGGLVGYGGGLALKAWLLKLEQGHLLRSDDVIGKARTRGI